MNAFDKIQLVIGYGSAMQNANIEPNNMLMLNFESIDVELRFCRFSDSELVDER